MLHHMTKQDAELEWCLFILIKVGFETGITLHGYNFNRTLVLKLINGGELDKS